MLELPEVLNMSSQLNEAVIGKQVKCVLPPSKAHKFCWYNGEPQEYSARLENKKIVKAEGFGIFVEIEFELYDMSAKGLSICRCKDGDETACKAAGQKVWR